MKATTQQERLNQLLEKITKARDTFLGYPVSKDFDYSELYEFLKYPINNLGDPFEDSTYKVQTHEIEREVVNFFAKLFRANPKDYWGYVTNGGSESNLYGLYIAREMYPKAMVYYSESTHYSVKKNIHLLNIPSIVIRSQENGEIDYNDLEETLKFNRHKPAIVLTTYGTTMKEAKDDVSKVKGILKKLAIQDHYIHCDGALAGSFGAFVEPKIPFDFMDGADSISISGHKFIGSPIPAGVIVTRRSLRDRVSKGISYIGSLDTTITGSRNGHSPLFLWYAINKLGIDGLKARYNHSLEVAKYCNQELLKIGVNAWRNPGAITVVLPKMSNTIKEKWQLATEDDITHIICMPNVTKDQIDHFIKDVAFSLHEKEEEELAYF
ncbi:histidine decarboxylase [Tenacibaculum sp. E3R01]|uniref:histidine decarboxylase n=1 Tax=unclassified Tenacibaculum TaxID=2635139 RepID=UPI00089D9D7C|nr:MULTISPECIES: histidine decarboxylase [unclassified Tenacibaculum]RBW54339.1 histidine decarboxylase [Tenacibaculum sp. E3R01]SED65187.1 L-histidine carboxy-lyase (histamine-forming) [Tenacibaculum sp. MAR_2010_89]